MQCAQHCEAPFGAVVHAVATARLDGGSAAWLDGQLDLNSGQLRELMGGRDGSSGYQNAHGRLGRLPAVPRPQLLGRRTDSDYHGEVDLAVTQGADRGR